MKNLILFSTIVFAFCSSIQADVQKEASDQTEAEEHREIAISVLRNYRNSLIEGDIQKAKSHFPKIARSTDEDILKYRKFALSRIPDPDRDYIFHVEASEGAILAVWRFEPDHPDFLYVIAMRFKRTEDHWIIDAKSGRSGSGPVHAHDEQTCLKILQEVKPESYTLQQTSQLNGEQGADDRSATVEPPKSE